MGPAHPFFIADRFSELDVESTANGEFLSERRMKGIVLTGPVRVSGVARLITELSRGQAHGRSGRGLFQVTV
jgi:hypothetical protein